jgi:hypothetical protein
MKPLIAENDNLSLAFYDIEVLVKRVNAELDHLYRRVSPMPLISITKDETEALIQLMSSVVDLENTIITISRSGEANLNSKI